MPLPVGIGRKEAPCPLRVPYTGCYSADTHLSPSYAHAPPLKNLYVSILSNVRLSKNISLPQDKNRFTHMYLCWHNAEFHPFSRQKTYMLAFAATKHIYTFSKTSLVTVSRHMPSYHHEASSLHSQCTHTTYSAAVAFFFLKKDSFMLPVRYPNKSTVT
jgi:hypothetical protein